MIFELQKSNTRQKSIRMNDHRLQRAQRTDTPSPAEESRVYCRVCEYIGDRADFLSLSRVSRVIYRIAVRSCMNLLGTFPPVVPLANYPFRHFVVTNPGDFGVNVSRLCAPGGDLNPISFPHSECCSRRL